MISEKILNSFISSNLKSLGLHHVNSEVPKIVTSHVGKRTDILAFDLATSVPITLELKVKRDPQVVRQVQDYISLISQKYPNLFEELYASRRLDDFRFDYHRGVVGMVLSPEPPPDSIADQGSTIVWAQFSFSNDHVFRIINRQCLSASTSLAHSFKNRPPFKAVMPSDFVASSLPKLRVFADLLDKMYLSVSPTINPRPKFEHSYIAYYGTDTGRVVFGFNTGPARSNFDVEFSVYEDDHAKFRSHPATRRLSSLGLEMDRPRKNQICPVGVDEEFAGDESRVSQALMLFKEMAQEAHGYAIIPALRSMRIDPSSNGGLALEHFGIH